MNISTVDNCYGCMACADRCPKRCIEFRPGRLGHMYPHVTEGCVDCGLCLKVCPAENAVALRPSLRAVAAWRTDASLRSASSSGGMAAAVSEAFVAAGGVVYGCAFAHGFAFGHLRCDGAGALARLRGSKYVQSGMAGTYRQMAADMAAGRRVLLIGTPCQVAAARAYFNGKDSLLFTIDLVCHGVPSAQVLRDSLPAWVLQAACDRVEFRVNTKFHFSVKSGISTVYERSLGSDLFLKGFFTALFYRDSCYRCTFAQGKRAGDMTLGDFWGLAEGAAQDEGLGVSLCLVNTPKGEALLGSAKGVATVERPLGEAIAGNKQLRHPMRKSPRARLFAALYPRLGFRVSVWLSIPEIMIKNKALCLVRSMRRRQGK